MLVQPTTTARTEVIILRQSTSQPASQQSIYASGCINVNDCTIKSQMQTSKRRNFNYIRQSLYNCYFCPPSVACVMYEAWRILCYQLKSYVWGPVYSTPALTLNRADTARCRTIELPTRGDTLSVIHNYQLRLPIRLIIVSDIYFVDTANWR